MRYLVRKIGANGQPRLGTLDTLVRDYANDDNAIRYMHRHLANLPTGQYVMHAWPRVTGMSSNGVHYEGGEQAGERFVAHLYRAVTREELANGADLDTYNEEK